MESIDYDRKQTDTTAEEDFFYMNTPQDNQLKGKRYVKLCFTDNTSKTFSFEKQGGEDIGTLMANVKKAIEANRLAIEADGSLFIIPMDNIKYVQVFPTPEALPSAGVIRNGTIIEGDA